MSNQYKILKVFRDKETGTRYTPNDLYQNNDSKRVAELQESGFLAGETPHSPKKPKAKQDD